MFAVKPYEVAALEAMPTRQLLGQLARLRRCEEAWAASDLAGQPLPPDYDPVAFVYFKDDARWQRQVQAVKRILASREHVARPAERRRAARQRQRTRTPRGRG